MARDSPETPVKLQFLARHMPAMLNPIEAPLGVITMAHTNNTMQTSTSHEAIFDFFPQQPCQQNGPNSRHRQRQLPRRIAQGNAKVELRLNPQGIQPWSI